MKIQPQYVTRFNIPTTHNRTYNDQLPKYKKSRQILNNPIPLQQALNVVYIMVYNTNLSQCVYYSRLTSYDRWKTSINRLSN